MIKAKAKTQFKNKNHKGKKHDDESDYSDDGKEEFGNLFEGGEDSENDYEEDEVQNELANVSDEEEDIENMGNKTEEAVVETHHLNMDMDEINLKIQNIVSTLSDFKTNKEDGKSRDEYVNELKSMLKIYYDYNEDIMTLVLNLFPPNEAVEFLEASAGQRVLTIRTNTLKTKRRELAKILINRGVNLDPLAEWTKVGLKIYDSSVPVGATPEYLAGHYMLQSGSSFLPVIALDPHENEKILDMCSAPGGKTSYIAQLMKNTGVLVANDLKKERLKSLYFNVHRLGVKNCIITNYDGVKLAKQFTHFDRVLLDAPCSGLGVISKDPSVKVNRTYKDIIETTRIQKELVLAAIDCCNYKTGAGIIVYSTCSISVEENEWVVEYALKNRYVKLMPLEFEIGEEGLRKFRGKTFHPSMNLTKRIYPHLHNMDGFFVAKLKKYADGPKNFKVRQPHSNQKKENVEISKHNKNNTLNNQQKDKKDKKSHKNGKHHNNNNNHLSKKQIVDSSDLILKEDNEIPSPNEDTKDEVSNKKIKSKKTKNFIENPIEEDTSTKKIKTKKPKLSTVEIEEEPSNKKEKKKESNQERKLIEDSSDKLLKKKRKKSE